MRIAVNHAPTPSWSMPSSVAAPVRANGKPGFAQAVFVTVLVWAALLCAVLGAALGIHAHAWVEPLAATAHGLQPPAGGSASGRAQRSEGAVATTARSLATVVCAGGDRPVDLACSTTARPPWGPLPSVNLDLGTTAAPGLGQRHGTPPGRAPPQLF